MLYGQLQHWHTLLHRRREPRRASPPDHLCIHKGLSLSNLWSRSRHIRFEGSSYCLEKCLEPALLSALARAQSTVECRSSHRVPLGLLLLSRGQIDAKQLRAALAEQQANGHGRIGEWLQALGFVTELQVTAALARQWSRPVSRVNSIVGRCVETPQIPATLLKQCAMVPLEYVNSTQTLFIAFSDKIDYPALYAIEQMMGCRTEPCMAAPSFVKTHLELLRRGENNEIVFDSLKENTELCGIVRSYCTRISATELRLAKCGSYLWIRLLNHPHSPLDLLASSPPSYTDFRRPPDIPAFLKSFQRPPI